MRTALSSDTAGRLLWGKTSSPLPQKSKRNVGKQFNTAHFQGQGVCQVSCYQEFRTKIALLFGRGHFNAGYRKGRKGVFKAVPNRPRALEMTRSRIDDRAV